MSGVDASPTLPLLPSKFSEKEGAAVEGFGDRLRRRRRRRLATAIVEGDTTLDIDASGRGRIVSESSDGDSSEEDELEILLHDVGLSGKGIDVLKRYDDHLPRFRTMLPPTETQKELWKQRTHFRILQGKDALALHEADICLYDVKALAISTCTGREDYIRECRLQKPSTAPSSSVLKSLTCSYMDLANHGMDPGCGKPLGAILRQNVFLTHINLTNLCLGDEVGADIVLAVGSNKVQRVLYFNLSENCLGLKTSEALERVVGNFECGLENLILSKNNLTDRCLDKLIGGLVGNMRLRRLDLSANKFSPFSSVGSLLTSIFAVEDLNIGFNAFGARGLLAAISNISAANSLTSLDLSFLGAGDQEAQCISDTVLGKQKSLMRLILGNNHVSSLTHYFIMKNPDGRNLIITCKYL
jgi:hypothetical protein